MATDIKKLYWELENILRMNSGFDGNNLTIKGLSFLAYMGKDRIDTTDLRLDDHNKFNQIIEREAFDLPKTKKEQQLAETLIMIVKMNIFDYNEATQKAYELIKDLSKGDLHGLFCYKDFTLTRSSLMCGENTTIDALADLGCRLTKAKTAYKTIDICSGEANFLSEAGYNTNPEAELVGYEINISSVVVSRMRLLMEDRNFDIVEGDALSYSMKPEFDAVFSNYPFSMRLAHEPKEDIHPLVEFNKNKLKADWLFIAKAINSINERGTATVIASMGVLFNLQDKYMREQVVEKGLLKMIIELPVGSMMPCSSVNICMMIFSRNNDSVAFVNARECYNKVGKNKTIDVDKIMDLIEEKDNSLYKQATKEEIRNNDYNLNPSNYFDLDLVAKNEKLINPHPIKQYATVFAGYQYLKSKVEEHGPKVGNIDVVKITNINNGEIDYENLNSIDIDEKKVEKFLLKENDILVSSKGTAVKVAIVEEQKRKLIPFNNLLVIRVNDEGLDPQYLCSFLSGTKGKSQIKAMQSGQIIMNVSKSSVEEVLIPIVDIDTQETIASRYLRIKKELVEAQNKINSLNEKLNSLYEDEVGE